MLNLRLVGFDPESVKTLRTVLGTQQKKQSPWPICHAQSALCSNESCVRAGLQNCFHTIKTRAGTYVPRHYQTSARWLSPQEKLLGVGEIVLLPVNEKRPFWPRQKRKLLGQTHTPPPPRSISARSRWWAATKQHEIKVLLHPFFHSSSVFDLDENWKQAASRRT